MDEKARRLKSEILKRRTLKYKAKKLITKNKVSLLLFTLLAIIIIIFIIAALLNNKGTFTISLPREQMIEYGLVLSDEPKFTRPRHEILSKSIVDMWNITKTDIPKNVNEIDGQHNGKNYLATTFYLKNMGIMNLKYKTNLDLDEVYKNVDDALRIEIYVDGVSTVYAKMSKMNVPEPNTVPFMGITRLLSLDYKNIDIGQVHKYTVVAWIEGEDPDCTNDLLGGFARMTMSFEATENK